jgi:protein-disulfide isomerase
MSPKRFWVFRAVAFLAIAAGVNFCARAQAQDSAVLKPPPGAKLALIVFEDLQCPLCARDYPLLQQAVRDYKIPLVRYDFPLAMHSWSFEAAVWGHYFDSKSRKLGDDFRGYIFEHQAEIAPETLRSFVEKFAGQQKIVAPFIPDPHGKFKAEVEAEQATGTRIGIKHTPTIYIVSNNHTGPPEEVVDANQLYQMIDAMKAETR